MKKKYTPPTTETVEMSYKQTLCDILISSGEAVDAGGAAASSMDQIEDF